MIAEEKQTIYLKLNNQKIPVWIFGKQSNPLLFVIHGYPLAFSDFVGDLPVKYLMDDYCIVAVDLPGFGYSKQLPMDFIAFLEIVINNIAKKRQYVLFGASFGGMVALHYALKTKDKPQGLIIAGMPLFPHRLLLFFRPISLLKKQFFLKHYGYLLFMHEKNLKQITIPILLLYSSKDKLAGIKHGKKLKKLLPHATLVTTDMRKHSWLLHRVDETGFLSAMQKFLANVLKTKL